MRTLLPTIACNYQSPLGEIRLHSDGTTLTGLSIGEPMDASWELEPSHPILAHAAEELNEYFDGRRTEFTVRTQQTGTPFQLRVWNALSRIPYGETRSYAEVAAMIGQPRASRAVGAANGKNRLGILVPCHRVIAADGQLGGYDWGIWRKASLLKLEQEHSVPRCLPARRAAR